MKPPRKARGSNNLDSSLWSSFHPSKGASQQAQSHTCPSFGQAETDASHERPGVPACRARPWRAPNTGSRRCSMSSSVDVSPRGLKLSVSVWTPRPQNTTTNQTGEEQNQTKTPGGPPVGEGYGSLQSGPVVRSMTYKQPQEKQRCFRWSP